MTRGSATRALIACVTMAVVMGLISAGSAWASEPFGVETFENTITNEAGEPATEAGSHPYAMTTTINLATHPPGTIEKEAGLNPVPDGDVKDIEVNLPAGVIVNPNATKAKCTEAELDTTFKCPNAAAIGVAFVKLGIFQSQTGKVPVFNMVPPPGAPAEIGFAITGAGIVAHIVGNARTGGDYGISAKASDILQRGALYSVALTLWGEPTAESHDEQRGLCAEIIGLGACPVDRTGVSLLTLPSACTGSPLVATVRADSWEEPTRFVEAEAKSPAVTGCKSLGFGPTLSVHPAEPEAASTESPTGLEVDLKIPQEEGLERTDVLAKSDLKEATVTLPAGMTVSPSAANGLGACNEAQIELNGPNKPTCPDSSKLGSVEVITPLLKSPLKGSVYLAQQGDLAGHGSNPFGSLFALYLVAEGSGALVKLPGEVRLDQATGQVSAKFGKDPTTGFYLPQLPFSELKMRFFGGPRAPLMTGASCGTFTTSSVLTPWDGNAPAEPASSFAIGSGCGAFWFSPSFVAGTTNNQAGGYTPFSMTFSRKDGEQRLSGVQVTMPPGLLGKIAGVARCGESQASKGGCGEASLLGEVTTAVGPGSDPYWVTGGKVYLTGPYNNGPFGLSIVVPTTAGPFTLTGNGGPGREVVRASIRVNPATAQITAVSDPLPTMLEGVPLDIRTVNVTVDRPGFMFNPTDCAPASVSGTLISTEGASASVPSPFEAANCAALSFKPGFSASTQDKTSKASGASLDVKVAQKQGEANIHKVNLTLPKALPARLTTLQKACTEAQFAVDPAGCPAGSFIGTATAVTPVLSVPLTGPAILVSHGGAAFPDVEFLLQGEGVEITLDGKTDIKGGITYSSFETVPDAPISSFETVLPQGPHSVLATDIPAKAKGNMCGQSLVMPTTITAQNGAVITQTTKVAVMGCASVAKKALTRAQKLKATLKACRKKYMSTAKRHQREACEHQAHKHYGPVKRKKK